MIRPTNRIVHLRHYGLPGRLHLPASRHWNGGRWERGTHGTPTNEHISLKRLDSCMSTLLNFICSRNLFNPRAIAVGNLVPAPLQGEVVARAEFMAVLAQTLLVGSR